jgi:hypothetical protein
MHAASVNPEPGSNSPKKTSRRTDPAEAGPSVNVLDEVPRRDAPLRRGPMGLCGKSSPLFNCQSSRRASHRWTRARGSGQGSYFRCHVRPRQHRERHVGTRAVPDRSRRWPQPPAAGREYTAPAQVAGGAPGRAPAPPGLQHPEDVPEAAWPDRSRAARPARPPPAAHLALTAGGARAPHGEPHRAAAACRRPGGGPRRLRSPAVRRRRAPR